MPNQGRCKVWKSGGLACSIMMGIICPLGWDRVNCLAKKIPKVYSPSKSSYFMIMYHVSKKSWNMSKMIIFFPKVPELNCNIIQFLESSQDTILTKIVLDQSLVCNKERNIRRFWMISNCMILDESKQEQLQILSKGPHLYLRINLVSFTKDY